MNQPVKAKMTIWKDASNNWFLDLKLEDNLTQPIPLRESDAMLLKKRGIKERPATAFLKEENKLV